MRKQDKPVRKWMGAALGAALLIGSLDSSASAYALGLQPFEDQDSHSSALVQLEGAPYMWNVAIWEGVSMIPARGWLSYLGYRVTWNEVEGKMSAIHPNGKSWVFWKGRQTAQKNGKTIQLEGVAPYTSYGQLYVPLRLTAVESGLQVFWKGNGHPILLRDPNIISSFSVMTRADNGVLSYPDKLSDDMKEHWKVNVNAKLYHPDYYYERTNISIASGDMTDLMLLERPFILDNELFQSFSLDLTEDIAQYPRLKALVDRGGPSARTIDGRIYGIPRPYSELDAPYPMIRQDWLDKFGIAPPSTMDELYTAMKQIADQWPGGSKKGPVIGLSSRMPEDSLGSLFWVEQAYTGLPDRFVVSGGKVVDAVTLPQERKALQWLARAHKDGLLDPGFISQSSEGARDMLVSGQVGLAAMTLTDAAMLTQQMSPGSGAEALWVPLTGLLTEDGSELVPYNTAGSGMYIIPVTVRRDMVPFLLDWLDKGIARSQTDGWRQLDGWTTAEQAAVDSLFGRREALPDARLLEGLDLRARAAYTEAVEQWKAVKGQTTGSASSTASEKSSTAATSSTGLSSARAAMPLVGRDTVFSRGAFSELISMPEEMKRAVITGEASLDEWDAYIEAMQASKEYKDMMDKLNSLVR